MSGQGQESTDVSSNLYELQQRTRVLEAQLNEKREQTNELSQTIKHLECTNRQLIQENSRLKQQLLSSQISFETQPFQCSNEKNNDNGNGNGNSNNDLNAMNGNSIKNGNGKHDTNTMEYILNEHQQLRQTIETLLGSLDLFKPNFKLSNHTANHNENDSNNRNNSNNNGNNVPKLSNIGSGGSHSFENNHQYYNNDTEKNGMIVKNGSNKSNVNDHAGNTPIETELHFILSRIDTMDTKIHDLNISSKYNLPRANSSSSSLTSLSNNRELIDMQFNNNDSMRHRHAADKHKKYLHSKYNHNSPIESRSNNSNNSNNRSNNNSGSMRNNEMSIEMEIGSYDESTPPKVPENTVCKPTPPPLHSNSLQRQGMMGVMTMLHSTNEFESGQLSPLTAHLENTNALARSQSNSSSIDEDNSTISDGSITHLQNGNNNKKNDNNNNNNIGNDVMGTSTNRLGVNEADIMSLTNDSDYERYRRIRPPPTHGNTNDEKLKQSNNNVNDDSHLKKNSNEESKKKNKSKTKNNSKNVNKSDKKSKNKKSVRHHKRNSTMPSDASSLGANDNNNNNNNNNNSRHRTNSNENNGAGYQSEELYGKKRQRHSKQLNLYEETKNLKEKQRQSRNRTKTVNDRNVMSNIDNIDNNRRIYRHGTMDASATTSQTKKDNFDRDMTPNTHSSNDTENDNNHLHLKKNSNLKSSRKSTEIRRPKRRIKRKQTDSNQLTTDRLLRLNKYDKKKDQEKKAGPMMDPALSLPKSGFDDSNSTSNTTTKHNNMPNSNSNTNNNNNDPNSNRSSEAASERVATPIIRPKSARHPTITTPNGSKLVFTNNNGPAVATTTTTSTSPSPSNGKRRIKRRIVRSAAPSPYYSTNNLDLPEIDKLKLTPNTLQAAKSNPIATSPRSNTSQTPIPQSGNPKLTNNDTSATRERPQSLTGNNSNDNNNNNKKKNMVYTPSNQTSQNSNNTQGGSSRIPTKITRRDANHHHQHRGKHNNENKNHHSNQSSDIDSSIAGAISALGGISRHRTVISRNGTKESNQGNNIQAMMRKVQTERYRNNRINTQTTLQSTQSFYTTSDETEFPQRIVQLQSPAHVFTTGGDSNNKFVFTSANEMHERSHSASSVIETASMIESKQDILSPDKETDDGSGGAASQPNSKPSNQSNNNENSNNDKKSRNKKNNNNNSKDKKKGKRPRVHTMPTSGSSASIIIGNENFSSNSNRRKSVSLDQSSTTPVAFLSRVLSTDSEFGCQITPVDGKKTKKRTSKQHYKQESPILPLLSPTIKNLTEDVNIGQTAFEFGAIVHNDDTNRNRNDRGLPTRARSNGRHLLQGLPPIKTGFTNNSSSSIDASDIEIHVQSSDNENDASDINNNDNDIKKKHKKSNDSDSDIHTDSDNSSEYNASDDEDHNTFIGILNNPSYDTITPPKVMTELSESRNLSHASRSSRSGNFRNHNQRPNNANIKSFNKNGECPFTFASVKGGGMTPSAFSPFGFKFIENVGIKSFSATVARVKSNAGSDISDISRFSHLDATQLRPHASTIGSSGSRDESKDNSRNIHTIHEANESFDDLDLPVFTNNVSSQHPPLNIQVTSPNDDKTRKSSVSLSMRTANLHDKNEINEETANMKAMFSDAYHRASVSMSHGINAMSRKLHTKQRKQAGLSTTQHGTTQVNPLYRINNANDDNNSHHNIMTIELPFDTNNNSSDTRRSTNSNDNNDDRRVTLSSDRGMDDTAIKNGHTTNNITLPEGNNYLMSSQTASGNSSDMDSDAKESTTATAPKPQKLTKLDNLEEFIRQVTATTDTKSYELTNALLFSYPLFGDSLNFIKILRTMFIRSKVYEIQSSIAQLIFSWIEQFWKEDFMGNFLLLSELKQFVYNDLKNQCVDHAKISRLESVFQTFLQANLNNHNNNNSKTSLEISGGILPTVATTFTSLTAKSPVSVYSPGGMGGMGGMGAGAASPSPDLSTPKVGSGSVSMLSKKNILSKNVSNGTSKSEDITLSNEIWNRWPYLNETLLMCSKTKKQKFNKTEYFEMMKLKIENRDTNKIKWNIMQYGKPTEIACQLTLMDHFVFLQIGKRECIAQGWKKEDKWERAPNLLQMIGQFNSVSTWCQLAIITCVSNKERSKMIEFVIKIAQHLYTLQNFSSLCAIHGALVSTPIQRYKSAWNKVRKKYNAMLQDISSIFHWRSNKLRELHNESKGALIPHIGVILQTMIAIEEADDVLDDNRINTHKMCIIASQVEKIVRWQKESYDKIVKTEKLQCSIVHDFLEQSHLTEDDVWNMSKESMKKDKK